MNEALSHRDLDCVRLRADLALLPLGEEVVAFSEGSQRLLGLNPSAAFMVQQLQNGMTAAELSDELVACGSVTVEESSRWIATMLHTLTVHGMTQGASGTVAETHVDEKQRKCAARAAEMPPYAPFEAVAEKHYRLLNLCARIRFARLDQIPKVDSVIGHLAASQPCSPAVTMDVVATTHDNGLIRSYLYKDGQPVDFVTGLFRLAPIVKGALWEAAVNAHDFRFYVHAGVVGRNEGCILLPAAAGSGKSSLTAALTHRGFRYFSDEVALLESATFKVPPVPLAFCVKKTGWHVVARYFPQILEMPAHERMDSKIVRYLPPQACGIAVAQASAPVSHIIFPRYDAAASTELTPVSRSEALRRLMAECLALRQRLTRNNVEELIDWISGIHCYALKFSSLDEACERIEEVTASNFTQRQ